MSKIKVTIQDVKIKIDVEDLVNILKALDHYTKHPVSWDKDQKGNLIKEGPSQVAILAIKMIKEKYFD